MAHVRSHPEIVTDKPEDSVSYNEEEDKRRDQQLTDAMTNNSISSLNASAGAAVAAEQTRVMEQMRKWGLHFDGRDAYSFLERLEE